MPISEYLQRLCSHVGSSLLLVPSVTGLVYDDAGRVLLVRHSNDSVWVAPGGAIDPDEAPQDAVVREVWEETGLHVEPTGLCGAFSGPDFRVVYANGDECCYVMTVFECRSVGGRLRADQAETLEARFIAVSDLNALSLSRWAKALLPTLVSRRGQSWIPPVRWTPAEART